MKHVALIVFVLAACFAPRFAYAEDQEALRQACQKATVKAIELEIKRLKSYGIYEERGRPIKGIPQGEELRKEIKQLEAELANCKSGSGFPDAPAPAKEIEVVVHGSGDYGHVLHPQREGWQTAYIMTERLPFPLMGAMKRLRMKVYPVYKRHHPLPASCEQYYVHIAQYKEIPLQIETIDHDPPAPKFPQNATR